MDRYEIRLVSDDPLVRQVFADEIEEAGHLVGSVGSRQLATLAPGDGAPVNLVLIDQSLLGDFDQGDLARLEAAWPQAHVALLADAASSEDDRRHFEEAFPVIAKETRIAELLKAVESAARGENVSLTRDAAVSRMDLLFRKITTRPAVAGIQRELNAVYDTKAADMPSAFADLLGKL